MHTDQPPDATVKVQIGISHMEGVPEAFLNEFAKEIASEKVELKTRTHSSMFAAMEWLIPTAIVVYITRAYFDAMFSEAGKDHYRVLKRGIKKLYCRAASLRVSGLGKRGKLLQESAYSLNFSIMASVLDHATIKFKIQRDLSDADAEKALNAFLELIESIAHQSIESRILRSLEDGKTVGRTLLLAYEFEREKIVIVDPHDHRNDNGLASSQSGKDGRGSGH